MSLFGRKSEKVVDWRYKKVQPRLGQVIKPREESENNFSFLGDMASGVSSSNSGEYESSDEKKKKLAKRILEMTERIEDLSNQIYHLQQRIDVLERRSGKSFE